MSTPEETAALLARFGYEVEDMAMTCVGRPMPGDRYVRVSAFDGDDPVVPHDLDARAFYTMWRESYDTPDEPDEYGNARVHERATLRELLAEIEMLARDPARASADVIAAAWEAAPAITAAGARVAVVGASAALLTGIIVRGGMPLRIVSDVEVDQRSYDLERIWIGQVSHLPPTGKCMQPTFTRLASPRLVLAAIDSAVQHPDLPGSVPVATPAHNLAMLQAAVRPAEKALAAALADYRATLHRLTRFTREDNRTFLYSYTVPARGRARLRAAAPEVPTRTVERDGDRIVVTFDNLRVTLSERSAAHAARVILSRLRRRREQIPLVQGGPIDPTTAAMLDRADAEACLAMLRAALNDCD